MESKSENKGKIIEIPHISGTTGNSTKQSKCGCAVLQICKFLGLVGLRTGLASAAACTYPWPSHDGHVGYALKLSGDRWQTLMGSVPQTHCVRKERLTVGNYVALDLNVLRFKSLVQVGTGSRYTAAGIAITNVVQHKYSATSMPRVSRFSFFCSMTETLDVRQVKRAVSCLTASILLMLCFTLLSHTDEAHLGCGCTSVLYHCSRCALDKSKNFKFRACEAFFVVMPMWSFHDRLLLRCTPRYFADWTKHANTMSEATQGELQGVTINNRTILIL